MRRKLCAVALAAVLTAAVSAAHVISGQAAAAAGERAASSTAVPAPKTSGAVATTSAPLGETRQTGNATRGATQPQVASTVMSVGAPQVGQQTRSTPPLSGPLRALAARRGLRVGAAVQTASNLTDAQYAAVLGGEYSMLTAENDMKWPATEPALGVYNFTMADMDVAFAQQHGMAVRGHNLASGSDNPAWLTSAPFTRAQLISILHDHITNVVGHYRGKVAQWDVVNEGFSGFWWDHVGPDYIEMAFRWAHEADPAAKLFFNDYGAEGLGPKSDDVYNFLGALKRRGVPIDGVGLESHFDLNPPSLADVAANMRRLNAAGFESAITEVDVRLPLPASANDLQRQAAIYNGLLATCLAASNCKTFASWGFTDKVSWIPNAYPGYGSALPFDVNYAPKPAYAGLRAALGG